MNILSKLLESPKLGTIKYIERRPIKPYIDGKATEEVIGYRYICILPDMGYAQIAIKIDGKPQLDEPSEPYNVVCDGLKATAYVNQNGRPDLSFRAEAIKAAK